MSPDLFRPHRPWLLRKGFDRREAVLPAFAVATMRPMGGPLRFSVGIPTRNQAEYLPLTLESLLQQRRPPDEIVLSDHQSTDRTPEIIADYVARHPGLIRAVQPPSQANLTGQYNFTLASQTGDWITLLSSDDLVLPNFGEAMVRAAEQHPKAALLRAPWQNIDASGHVIGQEYLVSVGQEQRSPQNLTAQKNGPKVSFAAFAVRREAWESSGPIFPEMESLADWALFVQLTPFGSFIRLNEVVSSYRMGHEGNKFRRRFGMWVRDEYRMFTYVLPHAADQLGLHDRRWLSDASHANFLRYLSAASKEFAPEERVSLLADLRPWAASVNETAALSRFAAGEQVRQRASMRDVARHLLRPLVHRVAHVMARR